MRSGLRLEAGQRLGDRYELVEPIGVGGMGEVWRGVDQRLRRSVAIKLLPVELGTDEAAVQRFRREAETTAGLQHPGITVMFDIDQHPYGQGTLVYLVMELLSGWDLRTALAQRSGGLPVEHAVSVTAQVAEALAAAHSRGVVHRDVKPANLFLLNDGRVKICDFGIARLADATTRLTASGGLMGTPLYMAPEQFRGEPLDPRADLYSLGCVLYEMLVGASPFDADTAAVIMYRHLNDPPVPPRSQRPEVPEHLDRLTLALLAKDPGERPPSAAAVVSYLRESGASTPLPPPVRPHPEAAAAAPTVHVPGPTYVPAAPTARPADPAARPRTRRKAAVVTAGALAAVAAIAAGAFAVMNGIGPGLGSGDNPSTPSPSRSAGPGAHTNAAAVVPGWHAMLAPGYGVAYDLPPGWKLEDPGTFLGFEDPDGNALAGSRAAATIKNGTCLRAQSGLRGGSNPAPKPSNDQLAVLAGAADQEARRWALAAYGTNESPPQPPRVAQRTNESITVNGITAAHVAVTVTPAAKESCTPPHAVVETLAMAATREAATLGPLIFVVFADRDAPGQAGDDVLKKIIGSVRPYTCPPGTRTHRDNKCSAG